MPRFTYFANWKAYAFAYTPSVDTVINDFTITLSYVKTTGSYYIGLPNKQYDTLYTIQCGAYLIEANAIAEVKRLNKLFKTNKFFVDYSDYYRVYYNKTHDKNSCMEWLNANRGILPKGSFIKEI